MDEKKEFIEKKGKKDERIENARNQHLRVSVGI
jgi:hypothetical protein